VRFSNYFTLKTVPYFGSNLGLNSIARTQCPSLYAQVARRQSRWKREPIPRINNLPAVEISLLASSLTALFSSGRVFFPKTAPWLVDYLHEMELFPSSAHDDMVDATTMGLAYLRSRQYDGGYGVIELFKKLDKFGWLDPGKPILRLPKTEPVTTAIVTRDQAKEWTEGHPPPCPHPDCKHPNTWLQADHAGIWHIHCRQCSESMARMCRSLLMAICVGSKAAVSS
jgi:hypothetical protein